VQQPVPFGKYILLERISVGGMAEVFKAKSFGVKGFAKIIAIKKILPQLAEDAHFVDMFVDEAKTSVQLTHANICQIFDLGREGTDHFIAMEYISGKDLLSLHNFFRRTRVRMPVHLVAYIAARLCEGLDYAHRRRGPDGEPLGIVHRDISPQNVIVSYDGGVKIIDFGIAKAHSRAHQETQAGVLKGKFGYMSPEQIEGTRQIDHRSDIFAIGTVVHELLTGRRLFLGDSDFATLEMVRKAEVPPASATNPEVPPELDAILFRALTRDPDERYAWASDMADELNMLGHHFGRPFAAQALGEWMVEHFAADIVKEKARHEIYAEIGGSESPDDTVEADATRLDDPRLDSSVPDASLDPEEEEATSLWEPIEEFVVAPPRLSPRHTRTTENVSTAPAWPAEPAEAPDPPALRTTLPGLPMRPAGAARRDVLNAVLLVLLAGAGGVLAYRSLDAQTTGAETAGLLIRVEPADEITIYVDNQVVAGRSPHVQKDLAVGSHALRIEGAGYEPWVEQITLRADEFAERRIVLQPVKALPARVLFVVSPPDATLTVDGHPITPAELGSYLRLPADRAVAVSATREGYQPYLESLKADPGGSRTQTVTLVPTRGSLFVHSDPPGDVLVDGERRGRTPQTIADLDVTREYAVRIERPGYQTFEERVRFGEKRNLEIEAKLQPERAPNAPPAR